MTETQTKAYAAEANWYEVGGRRNYGTVSIHVDENGLHSGGADCTPGADFSGSDVIDLLHDIFAGDADLVQMTNEEWLDSDADKVTAYAERLDGRQIRFENIRWS